MLYRSQSQGGEVDREIIHCPHCNQINFVYPVYGFACAGCGAQNKVIIIHERKGGRPAGGVQRNAKVLSRPAA